MAILATGGLGYVGSHVIKYLLSSQNDKIIILDDLSNGHIINFNNCEYYIGDIGDPSLIKYICKTHNIDTILHFAAYASVGESVINPERYYVNNIAKSIIMLEEARKHNVNKLILSSTATIYGHPPSLPILEDHPKKPINAYGRSKLVLEEILQDYSRAYGFNSVLLRYFNAAGADLSGELGEDHNPETHLIPNVLKVALGQRENISVFGNDYPTKDGTAVRNYVHVLDIAQAYDLCLKSFKDCGGLRDYNLGDGQGCSVLEVIETAEKITKRPIPYQIESRRNGDLPITTSVADKIKADLNWEPQYSDIETIIKTAWKWHSIHPNGFPKRKSL